MDTQTVNPERAWAEGMTQDEFIVGYRQRFGNVDTIPFVDEWVFKGEPKYHGVDPINPEDMVDDVQDNLVNKKKEEVKAVKEKEASGGCICKGCGKVAKSMFGLQAHQRHCKLFKEINHG